MCTISGFSLRTASLAWRAMLIQLRLENLGTMASIPRPFNVPWNLSLNYNFGLTKPGLSKATLIQAVQATGDLSLSKNFKISVSSGFDFTAFQPTITQLTLYRDLHCWDMSFSWTPFAGSASRVSNYSFTLKVKSAILQDLKVTRRRSFYDTSAY